MRLALFSLAGPVGVALREALEERGHSLLTGEESVRVRSRDIDAMLATVDELPEKELPRGPPWVAIVRHDALGDLVIARQRNVLTTVIVGPDPEVTRSEVERMEVDLARRADARTLRGTREALERSEEDYRGLFEAAHDAIVIFEPETEVILDANQRASEVYRIPRSQLIGTSLLGLSLDPKVGRERIDETLEHGSYHSFRTRQRRGDGTIMTLEINAARVSYGGETAIVSINRDVSEVHAARERLHQQKEELRSMQRHEAMGRLAAGVAHDFNNLLAVISVCAQSMEADFPGDPESTLSAIEDIKAAATDGSKMVRQLLELSRQRKSTGSHARPNELIVAIGPLLKRLLGERSRLALELDDRAPEVVMGTAELERALVNLVVNARDASPSGAAHITICTRLLSEQESGELPFPSRAGAYVEISVSDEGTGMDEATSRRIFEPYFTTKGEHGHGLGLATIYAIVTRTGGHIDVETQLGSGTTFRLYLPMAVARAEAASPPSGIPDPERRAPNESLDAAAFRTLLDAVDDAIYVTSVDDERFVFVSDAACRMVGYSRDELLQMGPSDLKISALRGGERHWSDQVSLLRSTGTLGVATVHRRRDGSVLPVEIRTTLQEYRGVEYVVSICRDARRPKTTGEPPQGRDVATLERMAGWVAHRINDPLTSVASNLEWLAERVSTDPELARVVEEAQRGIARAGESVAHVPGLADSTKTTQSFRESGEFVRWQTDGDVERPKSSGSWPVSRAPLDVLIVDDDRLSRMALTRLLRPHRVHVAESAKIALTMLATLRYDLVLCDLMMPELSGMALHALVEDRDPEAAQRMVFITGGGFTEEAERFMAQQAGRCYAKPLRRAALEQMVHAALGKVGGSGAGS